MYHNSSNNNQANNNNTIRYKSPGALETTTSNLRGSKFKPFLGGSYMHDLQTNVGLH